MESSAHLQFLEQYSKNQKKIYLYVLGMVHNRSDADDIMQHTVADMWKLFNRFEQGSSFVTWGVAIARYRILEFRKQQKRHKSFLSQEVYDQISVELPKVTQTSERRIDALRGCLGKLASTDSKLLNMHYEEGLNYKHIAEQLNRSSTGIYKIMARIHKNLHDCIRQTLAIWESGI